MLRLRFKRVMLAILDFLLSTTVTWLIAVFAIVLGFCGILQLESQVNKLISLLIDSWCIYTGCRMIAHDIEFRRKIALLEERYAISVKKISRR